MTKLTLKLKTAQLSASLAKRTKIRDKKKTVLSLGGNIGHGQVQRGNETSHKSRFYLIDKFSRLR